MNLEGLTQIRRHLHSIVETAFEENLTAAYIEETLVGLGLEVNSGIGGTGVVGTLRLGTGGPSIGLRADMDGLPMQELSNLPYKSMSGSAVHACGHDGHMTMVLGAAAALSKEQGLNGTVHFLFQPAEEPGRGARAMLDDGLLEKFPMDQIYGIHNMPGWPAGKLLTRKGPLMASEDNFVITVNGRGGHASRPQLVVDPILVAAEIIQSLQSVVSRSLDPAASGVISCTEVFTDGSRNAIPNQVIIKGDTRSFTREVQETIEQRMREIVAGICSANNATGEVAYTFEFEPTINEEKCTEIAIKAAEKVVGAHMVDPDCPQFMGSEDFGVFAREIPACFMFLGMGEAHTPLHNRSYDFDDNQLENGINFYMEVVKSQLGAK